MGMFSIPTSKESAGRYATSLCLGEERGVIFDELEEAVVSARVEGLVIELAVVHVFTAWVRLAWCASRVMNAKTRSREMRRTTRTCLHVSVHFGCMITACLFLRNTSLATGRGSAPACTPLPAIAEVVVMTFITSILDASYKSSLSAALACIIRKFAVRLRGHVYLGVVFFCVVTFLQVFYLCAFAASMSTESSNRIAISFIIRTLYDFAVEPFVNTGPALFMVRALASERSSKATLIISGEHQQGVATGDHDKLEGEDVIDDDGTAKGRDNTWKHNENDIEKKGCRVETPPATVEDAAANGIQTSWRRKSADLEKQWPQG